MGIRVVIYVDDGIVIMEGAHQAAQEVSAVIQRNLQDSS